MSDQQLQPVEGENSFQGFTRKQLLEQRTPNLGFLSDRTPDNRRSPRKKRTGVNIVDTKELAEVRELTDRLFTSSLTKQQRRIQAALDEARSRAEREKVDPNLGALNFVSVSPRLGGRRRLTMTLSPQSPSSVSSRGSRRPSPPSGPKWPIAEPSSPQPEGLPERTLEAEGSILDESASLAAEESAADLSPEVSLLQEVSEEEIPDTSGEDGGAAVPAGRSSMLAVTTVNFLPTLLLGKDSSARPPDAWFVDEGEEARGDALPAVPGTPRRTKKLQRGGPAPLSPASPRTARGLRENQVPSPRLKARGTAAAPSEPAPASKPKRVQLATSKSVMFAPLRSPSPDLVLNDSYPGGPAPTGFLYHERSFEWDEILLDRSKGVGTSDVEISHEDLVFASMTGILAEEPASVPAKGRKKDLGTPSPFRREEAGSSSARKDGSFRRDGEPSTSSLRKTRKDRSPSPTSRRKDTSPSPASRRKDASTSPPSRRKDTSISPPSRRKDASTSPPSRPKDEASSTSVVRTRTKKVTTESPEISSFVVPTHSVNKFKKNKLRATAYIMAKLFLNKS